ncbi:hypothetical protein [Paraburkholderia fynbosensis]|uniref:hypothetical protein n=1 Tax=Paraburkholderia fynbosensis TaxID=1200993 RepID=UPI001582EA54|nr:hypothetical protein [Paraburkholderia fynbosensis]
MSVIHVARVWTLFKTDDLDECFAAAPSADEAYEAGATGVAFARPWMAPAVHLARNERRALDSLATGAQHPAYQAVMPDGTLETWPRLYGW